MTAALAGPACSFFGDRLITHVVQSKMRGLLLILLSHFWLQHHIRTGRDFQPESVGALTQKTPRYSSEPDSYIPVGQEQKKAEPSLKISGAPERAD